MIEWLSKFWTLTYLETQHALLSENKTENERVWGAAEEKIACESIRFFRLKFLVSPAEKTRNLSRKHRMLSEGKYGEAPPNCLPSLDQRLDTFYSCSLLLARQNGGKFFCYPLVNFGVMFWLSFG